MSLIGYPRTLAWSDFFKWNERPIWSTDDKEFAFTTTGIVPPSKLIPVPEKTTFKLAPFDVEVQLASGASNTWVVNGKETAELLEHEQGHLEIAGLVAQELHLALETLRRSPGADLIAAANNISRSMGAKWSNLESQYDNETKNGTNTGKQADWNKKLATSKSSMGAGKTFIPLK